MIQDETQQWEPRPLFASLSRRDRNAIMARLDQALWWGTPTQLVVTVTRLLMEISPSYSAESNGDTP